MAKQLVTHFYIKKYINKIFDLIFLFLYHLYIKIRVKLLQQKNIRFARENDEFQENINEINNLETNLENMKSYMQKDSFFALDINRINHIINRKNFIKEIFSSLISITIHVYLIIYLYNSFNDYMKNDNDLNTELEHIQNIDKNDFYNQTFWYHAYLSFLNFDTYDQMFLNHYDVLKQPCRMITQKEVEDNVIMIDSDNYIDLTLVYHMMCHLATDKTIQNNRINLVIPKYMNITELRILADQYPNYLFNPKHQENQKEDYFRLIKNFIIPNICIIAVSLPEEVINLNHKHFPVEQSIDSDIPEGAFIHTSIKIKNETKSNVKYILNPVIGKELNETWALTPSPGQCSLMINPETFRLTSNNYTVIHSHILLKEKKQFDSTIFNDVEFEYIDINYKKNEWKPKSQKQNMYLQTTINVLYGLNDSI